MPSPLRNASALLLALASAARADVLLLQDGRRFEGLILSETPQEVTIDTKVSSIRSKMTFRRIDIRTLEKSALPDNFFGPDRKAPKPAPETTAPAPTAPSTPESSSPATPAAPIAPTAPAGHEAITPGTYLDVPLVGTFGEDIYPKGVEAALTAAEERGIKHVVFRIKSGGGEVWAARKITEILGQHEGRVTTHILIEQALSASIWVVFACDTIEIAPGGTVGAAVVYKREHTTGAAEVDAKMNSALAAELGAVAEQHGRDPAIVRAMIMPEAELYAWDEKGKVKTSGQRPNPQPESTRVLSNAQDVLTLTADEAARIGLAEKVVSTDAFSVGLARGIDGWTPYEKLGAEVMQKQSKVSADARADLERLAAKIRDAISDAVEHDPSRYNFQVQQRTGEMTPDSKRRWTELSDKAASEWVQARAGITAFEKLRAKAADLGLEGFISTKLNDKELKFTLSEIDQKLAELRKNRYRSTVPADFQKSR